MPRSPFQYAILRVVPRIERGECLNAGVVLFARTLDFLGVAVALDEDRLRALDPDVDPAPIAAQLRGLARIGEGDPSAGPHRPPDAVPAVPLARRALEHGGAAVGGPHRPVRRSPADARAPRRAPGPVSGRVG